MTFPLLAAGLTAVSQRSEPTAITSRGPAEIADGPRHGSGVSRSESDAEHLTGTRREKRRLPNTHEDERSGVVVSGYGQPRNKPGPLLKTCANAPEVESMMRFELG